MPAGSSSPVPVLTVCSLDPVLRPGAVAAMLCDAPTALVLHHDAGEAEPAPSAGVVRRTVFTAAEVHEHAEVEPGHGCLTCALTEDVLEASARLARRIAATFADVALTPTEHARRSAWWRAHGDDLSPWLGEPDPAEELTS